MIKDINKFIKDKSKIISLRHGVGKIIGNFKMYDGVDDYLEVEYVVDGDRKSRFFCLKHSHDVRLLSSKKLIKEALFILSRKLQDGTLENNFDEQSDRFIEKDVIFIVNRIVHLLRKKTLSNKDNILLFSSINSLILEVEFVHDVDHMCARGIVSDFLKCA